MRARAAARDSSRLVAIALVLGMGLLLEGCGGGSVAVPPPIKISVSPSSAIMASGGQQQFTATVLNASNLSVNWQVNGIAGGNTARGTISNTGLYTAPLSSAAVTVTAVSQADSSKSASATLSVLAPHAIGVRSTGLGLAEFYDRSSSYVFLARGNNYIRLAWQASPWGQQYYHSTFNVGLYDSAKAETALAGMQNSGYNVVRVFLNGCCANSIGNPSGGLSSQYIANVVDFLGRAANHGIYVILTWEWLPNWGGYAPAS